jgi:sialate O-acetylesterase
MKQTINPMRMKQTIAAAILLCCLTIPSQAVVRLPEALGDHMVLQQNADIKLWGWAFPGETVLIETSWGVNAKVGVGPLGDWTVLVKTPAAQPLSKGLHPENITFTVNSENTVQIKDLLIGEVWLCSGQSNMDMILRPGYPQGWCAWFGDAFWEEESKTPERPALRIFDVAKAVASTPQTDCRSALNQVMEPKDANGLIPAIRRGWQACTLDNRPYFHAVAYYFGAALQDKLDVPVGLVTATVGGTRIKSWVSVESLRTIPGFVDAAPTPLNPFQGTPGCLYNAMIAPLTPMKLRGAIWYQGESDVGSPYALLFQTMIADWRRAFGIPKMPFYFVQIAPINSSNPAKQAELREDQAAALKVENTGMAVSLDVSDPDNIHPKNKRDIGRRLAMQALAKTYGHTEIVADGPTPESVTLRDGKLEIAFRGMGDGLVSRDGNPLGCFEIAGEDGKFVPAEALITKESVVVVSNPAVAQPKHVRFAWGNADVPNLTSKNGLPVAQFRMTTNETIK